MPKTCQNRVCLIFPLPVLWSFNKCQFPVAFYQLVTGFISFRLHGALSVNSISPPQISPGLLSVSSKSHKMPSTNGPKCTLVAGVEPRSLTGCPGHGETCHEESVINELAEAALMEDYMWTSTCLARESGGWFPCLSDSPPNMNPDFICHIVKNTSFVVRRHAPSDL